MACTVEDTRQFDRYESPRIADMPDNAAILVQLTRIADTLEKRAARPRKQRKAMDKGVIADAMARLDCRRCRVGMSLEDYLAYADAAIAAMGACAVPEEATDEMVTAGLEKMFNGKCPWKDGKWSKGHVSDMRAAWRAMLDAARRGQ